MFLFFFAFGSQGHKFESPVWRRNKVSIFGLFNWPIIICNNVLANQPISRTLVPISSLWEGFFLGTNLVLQWITKISHWHSRYLSGSVEAWCAQNPRGLGSNPGETKLFYVVWENHPLWLGGGCSIWTFFSKKKPLGQWKHGVPKTKGVSVLISVKPNFCM